MEEAPLNFRLHSFRRHGNGHGVSESDDRLDDRGRLAALPQALSERPVDLDLVDFEAVEVAQARIAGAKIVQGDAEPCIPQLPKGIGNPPVFVEEDAFRDFKLDLVRMASALADDGNDTV